MAVVVEQTIPFSNEKLNLHDTSRWNSLFPLMRPSIRAVQPSQGEPILVDSSLVDGKGVAIVAVVSGNFSSKLLDERNVTAIVNEQSSKSGTSIDAIEDALRSAGVSDNQGVVVVRSGEQRQVRDRGPNVVEVELTKDVETDHILHLLGHANDDCRASLQRVKEVLGIFMNETAMVHSRFHFEKTSGDPMVEHSSGTHGYKNAKEVAERDMAEVMKAANKKKQNADVVYSVHYSDVNGLSRLENYILAGEIARHLESTDLKYQLSHSTILDHTNLARGFSISVCPLSSQHLTAQPKPRPHTSTSADAKTSTHSTTSGSRMTFPDSTARTILTAGCNALIAAEPTITKYDTIVGDGDCGYTLRDGAKQVLTSINSRDLSAANLPTTLDQLVSELEVSMGGTSGALYCIYLTALASAFSTSDTPGGAVVQALRELEKYTKARVGDRTMMDVLIPFAEGLEGSDGDAKTALEKARKGLEGTEKMEATLGRSSYLDDSATQGVPDPGAYGLFVLLEGMVGAAA